MRVVFLGALLLISVLGIAQEHTCGFDYLLKNQSDDAKLEGMRFDSAVVASRNSRAKRADDKVYYFPVVVHVIHNGGGENISDDAIWSQINMTNADLRGWVETDDLPEEALAVRADCRMELRLARFDPDGNPTSGINRIQSELTNNGNDDTKELILWDPFRYLNIWVVRNINIRLPDQPGTVLGYAYLASDRNGNKHDGIMIRSEQMLGRGDKRTLTHEFGHYMNLYHPFQSGCARGDCGFVGDRICDTPPTRSAHQGCVTTANTCDVDEPNLNDQPHNLMDYSDCPRIFTKGQKERMMKAIEAYRFRMVADENVASTIGDAVSVRKDRVSVSASIFPNPSTGEVSISMNGDFQGPIQIELIDLSGRSIWSRTFQSATLKGNNVLLNLKESGAKSGMYILKAFGQEMNYSERLTLE